MRGRVDNTEYYEQLGKRLQKIREEKNLLQKDIALKIGITFQQWQKYEKGTNRIPTKALVTFCEITQTDIKEITGSTVGDYEKVYKEAVVNYNTNNNVTNVYNYNGFFSNFLNVDLGIMKNKVVVVAIFINLMVWAFFMGLKAFPDLNAQYNLVFLSIQIFASTTALAIAMFVVFGYNILTYGTAYVAYICFYGIVVRFLRAYYMMDVPIIGASRLGMHLTVLTCTILTFYILKKLKVNINTGLKSDKKQV